LSRDQRAMGSHSLYAPRSASHTSGMNLDDLAAGRGRATNEERGHAEPAPPSASPARRAAPIEAPLLGEPPVVLNDPPAIFGGGSHTW